MVFYGHKIVNFSHSFTVTVTCRVEEKCHEKEKVEKLENVPSLIIFGTF